MSESVTPIVWFVGQDETSKVENMQFGVILCDRFGLQSFTTMNCLSLALWHLGQIWFLTAVSAHPCFQLYPQKHYLFLPELVPKEKCFSHSLTDNWLCRVKRPVWYKLTDNLRTISNYDPCHEIRQICFPECLSYSSTFLVFVWWRVYPERNRETICAVLSFQIRIWKLVKNTVMLFFFLPLLVYL